MGAPASAGSDKSDNEDTRDEARPFGVARAGKHALRFAATLLCARKLLPVMEGDDPKPAQEYLTEHFRWRAVEQARLLLEIIDKRWPGETEREDRGAGARGG